MPTRGWRVMVPTKKSNQETPHPEGSRPSIPEGQGRFPWWIWIAIALWLIYAFFLGPFNWFSPK